MLVFIQVKIHLIFSNILQSLPLKWGKFRQNIPFVEAVLKMVTFHLCARSAVGESRSGAPVVLNINSQ